MAGLCASVGVSNASVVTSMTPAAASNSAGSAKKPSCFHLLRTGEAGSFLGYKGDTARTQAPWTVVQGHSPTALPGYVKLLWMSPMPAPPAGRQGRRTA